LAEDELVDADHVVLVDRLPVRIDGGQWFGRPIRLRIAEHPQLGHSQPRPLVTQTRYAGLVPTSSRRAPRASGRASARTRGPAGSRWSPPNAVEETAARAPDASPR